MCVFMASGGIVFFSSSVSVYNGFGLRNKLRDGPLHNEKARGCFFSPGGFGFGLVALQLPQLLSSRAGAPTLRRLKGGRWDSFALAFSLDSLDSLESFALSCGFGLFSIQPSTWLCLTLFPCRCHGRHGCHGRPGCHGHPCQGGRQVW